jgi:hypothetical protein
VSNTRKHIALKLNEDELWHKDNPKQYEQVRLFKEGLGSELRDQDLSLVHKQLSRALKRKLKKGFLPYWHRPFDFKIWLHYYDEISDYFKLSFDSFGHVSLILMHRFEYLKKHFPADLKLVESYPMIVLIELARSRIITAAMIKKLLTHQESILARIDIIKAVEKKFDLFVYDQDLESMARNQKAFDSFILSVGTLAKNQLYFSTDDVSLHTFNQKVEEYNFDDLYQPQYYIPQFN